VVVIGSCGDYQIVGGVGEIGGGSRRGGKKGNHLSDRDVSQRQRD